MSRRLVPAFRAARAMWGGALLVAPTTVVGALGAPPTPAARGVARVLGLRHLAQAAVSTTERRVRIGGAIDLLHAGTMAVVAAISSEYGRAGATDAGTASLFAIVGLVIASPRRFTSRVRG